MRITEYQAITSFTDDNVFVVDGAAGTKKVSVTDAVLAALHLISTDNHRNIIRGKNLGTSVTSTQINAVKDGSFTDLWLGDYWTINGVNWRIVDMDYWYNTGDTALTSHHLVIMPDTNLYTAKMNGTAVTTGAYVGSQMYTTNLANAKSTITNAFGSYVLNRREYFTNAVTGDYASAGAWTDTTVDIPNEIQMFGSYIHTLSGVDVKRYTIDKSQIALFAQCLRYVNIGSAYWLRDVTSSSTFANVGFDGSAQTSKSLTENGVRPIFAIG